MKNIFSQLNRKLPELTDNLAVIGTGASFLGMIVALTAHLGFSLQLTMTVLSVSIGLLAGIFSMYLAAFGRKILHTNRVFLSYSHDALSTASKIATELRNAGAKIWLDIENIQPGDDIRREIRDAIGKSDSMVVIITQPYNSDYLHYELRVGSELGKKIIPVIVEGEVPKEIKNIKYIDFTSDQEKALKEIVDATI